MYHVLPAAGRFESGANVSCWNDFHRLFHISVQQSVFLPSVFSRGRERNPNRRNSKQREDVKRYVSIVIV